MSCVHLAAGHPLARSLLSPLTCRLVCLEMLIINLPRLHLNKSLQQLEIFWLSHFHFTTWKLLGLLGNKTLIFEVWECKAIVKFQVGGGLSSHSVNRFVITVLVLISLSLLDEVICTEPYLTHLISMTLYVSSMIGYGLFYLWNIS